MSTNLENHKKDLEKLIVLGNTMRIDLQGRNLIKDDSVTPEDKALYKKFKGTFERQYQNWYTESVSLIRQLLPDRLVEFQELYKGNGKRKATNIQTYNIQDWLNGVRSAIHLYTEEKNFNDLAVVTNRFSTQHAILNAVKTRFESSLHDIRQLVLADLFDSELDAARELINTGFLRAAGAVTGVVLEKHLGQVAANHNIEAKKQHPTISDFNDQLKASEILDVPAWRNIQRLGDLRNLCDHNKHRDPTKEEIEELVDGVDKLTKTLF